MTTNARGQAVALVTGAGRRIGRAIALALAHRGCAVAVHYRSSAAAADAVVAEIVAAGGRAATVQADLAREVPTDALMAHAAHAFGPVTCLINNASEFQGDRLPDLNRDGYRLHMAANLEAPLFLTQAFARQLPPGADGAVINIIDQRVWRPTPEFFSYSLSKAALWDATRMLAQALAPRIRVNAVGPGPVLQSVHQTAADFAAEQGSTLLGRGASPEEIAAAVGFILDAPAMTGQMIALDGGQHLAWHPGPVAGG
jgi:NAD(P)-dependent dehydrogenase (short-subunit alcohol dehydrogenase family)